MHCPNLKSTKPQPQHWHQPNQQQNRRQPFQHKPREAPFNAKAMRDELNLLLTPSEIAYLIQTHIDKGTNMHKIRQDKNFDTVWMKIGNIDGIKLPRIANVFPEVTCKYLQSCPERPITLKACIEETGCPDFPTIARHSACATLLPENFNFRVDALEVVLVANILFSEKIISQEEKANALPIERLGRYFNFLMKTYHSPVLPEGMSDN